MSDRIHVVRSRKKGPHEFDASVRVDIKSEG
jgi:hypothetical protein